jgi:hypothetical protein
MPLKEALEAFSPPAIRYVPYLRHVELVYAIFATKRYQKHFTSPQEAIAAVPP